PAMADRQTRHATGQIEVKTYVPTPFDEISNGPSLVEIHVMETFTGDIQGDGTVRFIQAAGADGTASFVGIERVRGSIVGRRGGCWFRTAARWAARKSTAPGSSCRGRGPAT